MSKIKTIALILALVFAVAALGLAIFAIGAAGAENARMEALEARLEALQEALDASGQTLPEEDIALAVASLLVDTWESSGQELTLTAAHVQVSLPKGVGLDNAALVLRLGVDEVDRKEITLPHGEGVNTYELTLTDTSFPLPAMHEGDQVDLWLEVTLSDGQILLSPTSGWYLSDGQLLLIAG